MERIFHFAPGEYLITDESSLWDFTGVDDMEITEMYEKIQEVCALDVSDIPSGNLLEIVLRIHHKTSSAPC